MAKTESIKNKKGEVIHPITDIPAVEGLEEALAGKQDKLISGVNIRKINGQDIVGSGEIIVEGGGGGGTVVIDGEMSLESEHPVQNKIITEALNTKQDELQDGVNIKTINGKPILGSGDLFIQEGDPSAVKFAPQELTEDQKSQARINISAASSSDLSTKQDVISTVNVSVDDNTGTPSATASVSGSAISFNFTNLKGKTGDTGATGATPAFTIGTVTTGAAGSPASATITGTAENPVLNITIPKGDQGNTGSSVDYAYELVNNRTTDDATKALSAAEGKRLGDDISQLEAEIDDLNVDINGQEKNYSEGHYLKQDGTIGDYATWGVTDFIPYTPGNAVTWKFDGASHNYYLGFFNANKEYISGSDFSGQYNAGNGGRLISASSINSYTHGNAAYLRASFNLDYASAEVIIGETSVWTPKEKEPSLQEQIDELKGINEEFLSLCEYEQIPLVGVAYQGKYVYKQDHEINESTSNGSFIIPVSVGDKILVRGRVNAYANYSLVAFTDDLTTGYRAGVKNLVVVDSNTNPYSYEYVFIADKAGYLMAWTTARVYGNPLYVEMFRLKERQEEIFDRYLPESFKLQTFGDSITDNYWGDNSSWVSYVPDNIKNTALTIVNSAVGGASIGGTGSYNIPNQIENGYTRTDGSVAAPLDSTADIVVIFAGTNDYAAGQSLGSVKENLATSFQYIFEHSKAKVLFCTPLQRYNETDAGFNTDEDGVPVNSNGMTLRQLCDELIKVCKRFSVPVLDLNADANINRYNISDYSLDGLHPQRWGDAYVSRLICEKIKAMMRYDLQ